jgi:LysM repeat protein
MLSAVRILRPIEGTAGMPALPCVKLVAAATRREAVRGGMVLVLLFSPGFVRSQEAGAPVHEVNRGDTLWGLAVRYLNDGPRWQEIYDLNGSSITDPDLILPGQRLRLPARSASVTRPATRESEEETPEREPLADRQMPPQEDPFAGPSLFDRSPERAVTLGGFEVEARPLLASVSRNDFNRAPFLATKEDLGPTAVTARQLVANPLRLKLPETIPLNRRVVLLLAGLQADVGDELIAFKWRHRIGRHGRVVEPVAVLTVLEARGDSAYAQVGQVFADYEVGDPVIRPFSYPEPPPVGAVPAEAGVTARILGIANRGPLLGLTEVAFLDVGAEQGIGLGDEFVTFAPNVSNPAAASIDDGQALLRVVQARPNSSTAVVVRMRDVGTVDGAQVRLVGQAVFPVP